MDKIEVRFSIIIAFVMSALCIFLLIVTDYIYYVVNDAAYMGEDCGGAWMGHVLFAACSLGFYFGELCLMVSYKRINKSNIVFTVILFILILVGAPLLWSTRDYDFVPVLIWRLYYIPFVALETIYFIRYLRSEPR